MPQIEAIINCLFFFWKSVKIKIPINYLPLKSIYIRSFFITPCFDLCLALKIIFIAKSHWIYSLNIFFFVSVCIWIYYYHVLIPCMIFEKDIFFAENICLILLHWFTKNKNLTLGLRIQDWSTWKCGKVYVWKSCCLTQSTWMLSRHR